MLSNELRILAVELRRDGNPMRRALIAERMASLADELADIESMPVPPSLRAPVPWPAATSWPRRRLSLVTG